MKKILITGGTGSIGTMFISMNYERFEIYALGNDKEKILRLKEKYPLVTFLSCQIENYLEVKKIFLSIRPEYVLHAAGIKRFDVAEKFPSLAININIIGSLNIIKASKASNVKVLLGLSSDKASNPRNMYGFSKWVLEKIYKEHFSTKTKLCIVRLVNVVQTEGSVIEIWKNQISKGVDLTLTDTKMKRFMITKTETNNIILEAFKIAEEETDFFIIVPNAKTVILKNLALKLINESYEKLKLNIIGKRHGETYSETLISKEEVPKSTYINEAKYIIISEKIIGNNKLEKHIDSVNAKRMSTDEIKNILL